jgi:hypothetical protein
MQPVAWLGFFHAPLVGLTMISGFSVNLSLCSRPFFQMDRVTVMVLRKLSLVLILLGAASIASSRGSWAADPRQATGQYCHDLRAVA